LPTNCMFVVIPSDGLCPATYAKELYYHGEQSSSIERLQLMKAAIGEVF
jgi:hypothetical protein